MRRELELTIRLNEDDFAVDVYEPESGETSWMRFPFSPDEHPEFDRWIGEEIYSWISLWADEKEDENE